LTELLKIPAGDSRRPLVPWFYNPNIHPAEEHDRRRDAVAYLAARIGTLVEGAKLEVDFSPPYEPEVFLARAARNPEAPERCRGCYGLRLGRAAEAARALGLGAFTTTLLYSRRQRHELVVEAGGQAAIESGGGILLRGLPEGLELGDRALQEARALPPEMVRLRLRGDGGGEGIGAPRGPRGDRNPSGS
jgi:hypothetical protein